MIFSNEILNTIFSHQTSFVYVLDTEFRVLFASQPLLKYIKKTEAEVLGKTLTQIGYPDHAAEKLQKIFIQALQGHVVTGEDFFTSLNGGEVYFEYTFAPAKDENGEILCISAVIRDISDRKKIEEKLNETIAELKKERELRDSFIMAMTHDLRTPLTAAKLSAQVIQRHPTDGKAIDKFSGRIIENVERTDTMIRDLLDSLRLKAGEGIMLNIQQNVLNAQIETIVEELTAVHGNRFLIQMSEMVKGYWDAGGIRRVLENLLTNAVKYGDPLSPITIKLYNEKDAHCISVHNSGDPLSKEELSDLFVPFKRLKNAKDSGQKGWGIGLSLVLGIVEAHRGSVTVDSEAEKGTIFTVKLP